MADNKTIPATGSGAATPNIRTKDRSGIDTQIVALDLNPAGTETLMGGAMPVTVGTWKAAPTSRSTVLTTELNSLANAAYSAVGTALDNTTNLDQYGALDVVLASLTPTAGAYLSLYLVQSLDGTTYEDPPSSTNPGTHMLVDTVLVTTGAAAKRIMSRWFRLPPGKFKFIVYNATGVALGATGNTATLYTSNG